MVVGAQSRSKLLERANRARKDATVASPFALWEIAEDESSGDRASRRELFGHAMLHAGYVVAKATGKPYTVCPVCGATLG